MSDMKETRIVAVDIGTCTGLACWDYELQTPHARVLYPFGFGVKAIKTGSRWTAARACYREALKELGTGHETHVYAELMMGSKQTRAAEICLTGLEVQLIEVCADLNLPLLGVAQPKLKKFATGKGNGKKELMGPAAIEIWPEWAGPDVPESKMNNVHDALCLLAFGIKHHGNGLPELCEPYSNLPARDAVLS